MLTYLIDSTVFLVHPSYFTSILHHTFHHLGNRIFQAHASFHSFYIPHIYFPFWKLIQRNAFRIVEIDYEVCDQKKEYFYSLSFELDTGGNQNNLENYSDVDYNVDLLVLVWIGQYDDFNCQISLKKADCCSRAYSCCGHWAVDHAFYLIQYPISLLPLLNSHLLWFLFCMSRKEKCFLLVLCSRCYLV